MKGRRILCQFSTALLARTDDLHGVTITCLPAADYGWFNPEHRGRITVNVLYAGASSRAATSIPTGSGNRRTGTTRSE